MSEENVELMRTLIPPPETDLASLFRDDELFGQMVAALEQFIDPDAESVAIWRGGATYRGVDGFRRLWLDWLEPWATYFTQAEELIDAGDRVVVLVRDRGRRHDLNAEVELISGSVWEIREGKIVRVAFCGDRDEALAVAGVSK
jgi:ketosteroid isomerase-like protein